MTDRSAPLILILIQTLVIALAGTSGEFPVNDGWVYAHSVRWLVDEHLFRLSDWTSPNLLPQILLGTATSEMFGYSLQNLRHLTQAVSVAASLAAYGWFRSCRLSPRSALVACLVVIAMPCWPVLASSFMSDIYGLLFALLAAAMFIACLRRQSWQTMALGGIAAAIGVLERQLVIVVPLAFGVAWMAAGGRVGWRATLAGWLPLAFACFALVAYHTALVHGSGVPSAQREVEGRVLTMLLAEVAGVSGQREWLLQNVLSLSSYLGLFLVGWAAWNVPSNLPASTRVGIIAAGGSAAALALWMGWLPPYRANFVIDAAGIGPFTLYDGIAHPLHSFDRSPGVQWRIAGVAAMFGMIAWFWSVIAAVLRVAQGRVDAECREDVFLLVLVATYLTPLAITDYFDRYLVMVMPFAIAILARTRLPSPIKPSPVFRVAAMSWIGASLLWGSLATHDYFAWNRARWAAITYAEALGASPTTMDGGYEYNGYFSDESRQRTPGKSWWWVKDDRWVVSFSPIPGYRTVNVFAVHPWLARSPDRVLLQRRLE